MSIKLHLVPGDRVRNVRAYSSRRGKIGTIIADKSMPKYVLVAYDNGVKEHYLKSQAHVSLEKIESACPCQQHVLKLDYSKLEERILANPELWANQFSGTPASILQAMNHIICTERVQIVHDEIQFTLPKRRTLKKVRRNVITGKTQEDMVKDLGYARGVEQFNTRATGRTSAAAMRLLGVAMENPGYPVDFRNADHAVSSLPNARERLNDDFQRQMSHILAKLDWKGFTFHKGDRTVTFNPIVTEETYAERH